jgi:hypothetical protein
LVKSLNALLLHIESGAIQDTALPGTASAEATRLVKNGLSVSTFACFEHFVRSRMAELLRLIETSPDLPAFDDLPQALKGASTKGVVEALRYRLSVGSDELDFQAMVALVQEQASRMASTRTAGYQFSHLAFGWSRANVNGATLQEFLGACGAPKFFNEFSHVLQAFGFDFSAAGLAENGQFKIGRLAQWRHVAAHDATHKVDVQILKTRIVAYLSLAAAFDFLGSLAVRILIDGFGLYGPTSPEVSASGISLLVRGTGDSVTRTSVDGTAATFYSLAHCRDSLGSADLPLNGIVVALDSSSQLVDWFFH